MSAKPALARLLDRYLAEHVEVHNKPTSRREIRRLVERELKPALGRPKVADVTHEDVARMHRAMAGKPRTANYAVAVLSKAMSLKVDDSICPERPDKLQWHAESETPTLADTLRERHI